MKLVQWNPNPHLLQLFSRTLQLCFTVKLQNCSVDDDLTLYYQEGGDDDWVHIFEWTAPLGRRQIHTATHRSEASLKVIKWRCIVKKYRSFMSWEFERSIWRLYPNRLILYMLEIALDADLFCQILFGFIQNPITLHYVLHFQTRGICLYVLPGFKYLFKN